MGCVWGAGRERERGRERWGGEGFVVRPPWWVWVKEEAGGVWGVG